MKKYLITGGAGFIGSNIVKRLLELGESVRVVDNFSTGKKENIKEFIGNSNFELIEGDLTDSATAIKSVDGIDYVLHQAAIVSVQRSVEDPSGTSNANIVGTLKLLIASKNKGIKKFVYASSSSIYGDSKELPKREDFPINPISPYALAKYAGEKYTQIFWQIYKLPTVSLRYFNVFGPKQDPESQYAAVIPRFITALLKKEKLIVYGDGEQSRDFTYVDNVVDANLLAAENKNDFGEIINIACGKQTNLNELIQILQKIIGEKINPEYKEARAGDVLHSIADISKAKRILGFIPKIEFEEGLTKTVNSLKENERL